MQLIAEVDKSGSDVEIYVNNLDQLLLKKMQMIATLRKKVFDFNSHLQLEKQLQTIYQKKQDELENNGDNQDMTDYDDDEQEYP